MKKAALYLRVSTDDQVEMYGLSVQLQRTKAMAKASGYKKIEVYSDKGVSGTLASRPELDRLMRDVEAGDIEAIIVLALDRLGRKTRIVLDLVEKITIANVALISVKENLNTTTPMGQFTLTILAGLAQLERDNIVERTTAGRNMRGTIDGEKGGKVPYGYSRGLDGIEIRKDHAEIVKRIFSLKGEKLTLRAIADKLNAENIPSATGKKWIHTAVKTVLDNEGDYRGGRRGESNVEWPTILV